MAKFKLFAIVAVLLMLSSLMSVTFAARTRTLASFSLRASGECAIIDDYFGQVLFGKGTGTINFIGNSNVQPLINNGLPTASWYQSNRMNSQNSLTANWNGHSIGITFLNNRDVTAGFFGDSTVTGDYIFLGVSPFNEYSTGSMLRYQGIYTNQAGTQQISGYAFVYAIPVQDGGVIFNAIIVVLFDHSGKGLFEAVWVSQDYDFGILGIGLVHAANPFVTSLIITP